MLDLMMPKKNGYDILCELKPKLPQTEFIILTAVNNIYEAVKCLKAGAFDYLTKPPNINVLMSSIKDVYEQSLLKESINIFVSGESLVVPENFTDFFTQDSNTIKILNYSAKIAERENNIVIMGPTGSGKELLARAIHKQSKRNKNNFVSININSIPSNLFETTLFGYKKGAFTGALKDTDGLIKSANNGTLFLDEIGDLDIPNQIKLLQVLEEKKYYPVGGLDKEHSDFRLICATNKNLKSEVDRGAFRMDLYYRIIEHHIYLPPICERNGDIIYLAKLILDELNKKNKTKKKYNSEFSAKLSAYELPGNYRELKHIIECAYDRAIDNLITADCIKCAKADHNQNLFDVSEEEKQTNKILTLEQVKINHIKHILHIFPKRKKASKFLGITERQLYNYISKYGL